MALETVVKGRIVTAESPTDCYKTRHLLLMP